MFTERELIQLSIDDTAKLLFERTEPLLDEPKAPQHLRDLAVLFELDHQVRNGGFAQYFFNKSCANAFDAWFASEDVETEAHELLSLALIRLGAELGIDLDLRKLVEAGDSLGPPYGSMLEAIAAARSGPATLLQDFARFRDRLGDSKGDLAGFETLQMRFFEESHLPRALVEYVRSDRDAFVG